jgi:DivIVA domain-containing protein
VPLLLLLVILAVLAAVALVAAGRGDMLADAPPEQAPFALPEDGPLTPADLEDVRFALAFRGYRMDQVDALIDRLLAELDARDARIAALEGERVVAAEDAGGPA